ncbi:MAG: homoserine kinase [Acidimicrobiales bacterium]
MRARAPASSANLGPGFDVLALALALYVEVEIVPAERFSLSSEGEGSAIACDGQHLAAQVASAVCGHDRLAIRIRSEIPIRRGLGSSAALAVAVAAAAGAPDPLKVAGGFEGHLENAAASVSGGLVSAALLDTGPVLRRFPLDPGLAFVLLIPERELATSEARRALKPDVTRADAVFNLSRMALLLAGLADRSVLIGDAGDDRLHQFERSRLFPEAAELLARLAKAGALVSCWSGAGPSLLGICDGPLAAARVRDAGEAALEAVAVPGRAVVLSPDLEGLVLER